MSSPALWLTVALILALVAAIAIGLGLVLSWVAVRLAARRLRPRVAAMLPTGASVLGVVPAVTPPATLASMRWALILAVFPGLFIGPFVVPLFAWLAYRGRSFRAIAFTADDETWLVGRTKWRGTLTEILGHQPTSHWSVRSDWRMSYAMVAGESLSFPR